MEESPVDNITWGDFDYIFHTTHFTAARAILSTRQLKALPVDDDGCMPPNGPLSVVWVSPNNWPSFFGSIRFRFSWPDIVNSYRLFHIGMVAKRQTPTYRMLITAGSGRGLKEYDPRADRDTIQRGNSWYRHLQYNLEFMLDDHIDLSKCNLIISASHIDCRCSTCKEKARSSGENAGRFLAWLLIKGERAFNKLLVGDDGKWGGFAKEGYKDFRQAFCESEFGGNITGSAEAELIIRSALLSYARSSEKVWGTLSSLCSADLLQRGT